jgi:hypothetical protein
MNIEIADIKIGDYSGYIADNGDKIYEGDIVLCGGRSVSVVIFDQRLGWGLWVPYKYWNGQLEFVAKDGIRIIGNFYEQPTFFGI